MILDNTAIAQCADPRMICLVLSFVGLAILAYLAFYLTFIFFLIDPNVIELYRNSGNFANAVESAFLVIQFLLQLWILFIFKKLGTNLNTDEESN
jgi:hypothetical protein